jgi:hypothetical protein
MGEAVATDKAGERQPVKELALANKGTQLMLRSCSKLWLLSRATVRHQEHTEPTVWHLRAATSRWQCTKCAAC